jgi:hypothetical protein
MYAVRWMAYITLYRGNVFYLKQLRRGKMKKGEKGNEVIQKKYICCYEIIAE